MSEHLDNEVGDEAGDEAESAVGTERRSFILEASTGLLGVCLGVGPVIAGLWGFVFDPFRKRELPSKYNTGSGDVKEGHYLVATTDSLPEDGTPQRFEVISDKYDAWNFIPRQPIGSVYLRKLPGDLEIELEDGSKKVLKKGEIDCLQTTCPHAGCSVSYDGNTNALLCPCHNSEFELSGAKRTVGGKDNPSPRSLDRLDTVLKPIADGDNMEIYVEFMEFYTGVHEKNPVS